MSFIFRGFVLLAVLLCAERAQAAVNCSPGSTRSCTTDGDCVGRERCYAVDPDFPTRGEWGGCAPTYAHQACGACGTGGYAVCNSTTGLLGPCRPATALGGEVCGNSCDDNASGTADEWCAGSETFDYCEPKGNGTYTRWTCACGDGLNVGYCLGSGDPQYSCDSASGCLKAPAFGSTNAAQGGGNYRCCVSSLPCTGSGYVAGKFMCGYGGTQSSGRYECSPGSGCQDANQCGDTCEGLAATFDTWSGQPTGHGSACRPADYSHACTAAQGGLSNMQAGGIRPFEDEEPLGEVIEVEGVVPPMPGEGIMEPLNPDVGGDPPDDDGAGGGGGGGGGGGDSGDDGAEEPIPSPEPNQCGPTTGGAVTGSALSAMSSPRVSLSDLTTRHTEVDVGIQGTVGGLNFVRKFVSTDDTWKYFSMLSAGTAPFLPAPYGVSPTHRNSLRWWHGFYSFVRPRGWVPGVSTWAVRDMQGAILEYTACDAGSSGCYATPRPSSRWSTSQLYWTGGSTGYFILMQPGSGRYVYASGWQPSGASAPTRYFLTRVEDRVLSGSGYTRVRLSLQYAAPPALACPGLSATGNGVPYLASVTTADGAQLRLYYKSLRTQHGSAVPGSRECVLDTLALRNNPNSGSTAETVVARYHYFRPGGADETAGGLESVTYPETGDTVTYLENGGTSWSVSANGQKVGEHLYTSGKVTTAETSSGGAMSLSMSTSGCALSQYGTSTSCGAASTEFRSTGDSTDNLVEFRRTYNASPYTYVPYLKVDGYTDTCLAGNCVSFASGRVIYDWKNLPGSYLHLANVESKTLMKTVFKATVANGSTASAVIPQPLASVTRAYGATDWDRPETGVYSEREEYGYGSFILGAPPEPFRPLVTERQMRASVLVSGQEMVRTARYDSLTHRLKSIIQEGYTERFHSPPSSWTGPVKTYVGTFYFNHYKCEGGTDTGDARVMEIHGPCTVNIPDATDCAAGSDFRITQYHYYGPPGTEASNRANRLKKVRSFTSHGGASSCAGAPALETVFDSYDSRGNATQLTDSAGGVSSLVYTGGRLDSVTVNGQTTQYRYDGADITAVRSPDGSYRVRCYREGTAPGTACSTGVKTAHVQWEAVAADPDGVDWSEAVIYTRWPTADESLKTAEYRSRSFSGGVETRRVVEYHPDPHGRTTYTRVGAGSGSYASVAAFDKNSNLTAVGLPFNGPPDFCRDVPTQGLSQLCAELKYDQGDRLASITETPGGGVSQAATFAYDAHSRVSTVRTGCTAADSCQSPAATYQYDDFGNLLRVQLPGSLGPVRQAYDARGNVVLRQTEGMRQAGEWQTHTYDALSRLKVVTRNLFSGTPATEVLFRLGYDGDGGALPPSCSRYDGEVVDLHSTGRLRYRDDSFGRTWYRYDAAGRLVAEMRQRQGDTACNRMLATAYQYDSVGRPSGMTYPYGRSIGYSYGTGARAGRVSSVSVSLFTSTGGALVRPVVSNIAWEPFGGLRGYQINHANGNTNAVEYALGDDASQPPAGCASGFPSASASDRTGRLRSLRVSTGAFSPGSGGGDVYKRTYTWNADQVARIDTCLMSATVPRTELYSYDRTLRLTGATRPTGNASAAGGAFQSQGFTYDRRGNRTTLTELSTPTVLAYGAGALVDQLLSVTPQDAPLQQTVYGYDADGRAVRRDSGRYLSSAFASEIDMSYSLGGTGSRGSARETVFRTATVDGLTYQYFYDALGRRRAKQYPFNGVKDEYFHGAASSLLVDQGWNDVVQPGYRTVDEYVWLAGRPLMMIRGRLDASTDTHLPDTTTDCGRNGAQAACGERFIVTDHVSKPVLMLDAVGRVAGAADYQPFGHVNREAVRAATPHPYLDDDSETIASFSQPLDTSLVRVRMRALFQLLDTQDDVNGTDSVTLYDDATGVPLANHSGPQQGRVVTDWVQATNGRVNVSFAAGPQGAQPNAYTGVVVEAYEYQRYQAGAQPFWTPLRFPGQYHDEETDFFENWNRYYDAGIGRYMQPEPLLASGPMVLPAYAYAANNPLYYVDPSGLIIEVSDPFLIHHLNNLRNHPIAGILIRELDRSPYRITLALGQNGTGVAGETTRKSDSCSEIQIDRGVMQKTNDYIRETLGVGMTYDLLLMHELGHAYANMHNIDPLERNQMAVDFENLLRPEGYLRPGH